MKFSVTTTSIVIAIIFLFPNLGNTQVQETSQINLDSLEARHFEPIFNDLQYPVDRVTKKGESKEKFMSNSTINLFFRNHIQALLSKSGDITLSKGLAIVDVVDDKLYLGMTFSNTKKKTDKLSWVGQVGFSNSIKNGFAQVFKPSSDFANGMSLSGKFTWIANGKVSFEKPRKINIAERKKEKRNKIIQKEGVSDARSSKIIKEAQIAIDSAKSKIDAIFNRKIELNVNRTILVNSLATALSQECLFISNMNSNDRETISNKLKEKVVEIQNKKRSEFVEEDVKYFNAEKDGKLKNYQRMWTAWFSVDVDVAITKSDLIRMPDLESVFRDTVPYRPQSVSMRYTNFWKNNFANQIYLTGILGYSNYTQVQTDNLSAKNVSLFESQVPTIDSFTQSVVNVMEVYNVSELDNFGAANLGVEFAVFPRFLKVFGFRANVDWTFYDGGQYMNRTLAIPFTFKDKDSKPTIKFEVQYRKVFGKETYGLSTGIPFGGRIHE